MQLETQQPKRQAEHDLVFQVRAAQADPAAADTLIGQYMPFIRSETYKFTHAPIEAGHEDELSIATLAFYEAALSYQKGRGAFLPYAAAAIRNRLIDHYRAARRPGGRVSLDAPAGAGRPGPFPPPAARAAMASGWSPAGLYSLTTSNFGIPSPRKMIIPERTFDCKCLFRMAGTDLRRAAHGR